MNIFPIEQTFQSPHLLQEIAWLKKCNFTSEVKTVFSELACIPNNRARVNSILVEESCLMGLRVYKARSRVCLDWGLSAGLLIY